jgi:L-Ala-D/L-Glu epimerase
VKSEVGPYSLRLGRPLAFGWGTLSERAGWIVSLAADGVVGVGEAAPLPGYAGEALGEVPAAVAALAAEIRGLPAGYAELAAETRRLARLVPGRPAALAGVTFAMADAAARRAGLPLARWLSTDSVSKVAVNAVVVGDAANCAQQAAEYVRDGFGCIKVKLGAASEAPHIVAAVRAAVGAATLVRADANGGWTPSAALLALEELADYDVDYVEQPLAANDIEGLALLRSRSPVAIAADESLLLTGGVDRVAAADAADVWILKPSLMGGPAAAIELARTAREMGVRVVVTSAFDAAVGRAGALHVAAALGGAEAAGLATGGLFERDVGFLPEPRAGKMIVSELPGLGVDLSPDWQGGGA